MYAGGFGNQILTDWGFLQKRKKKKQIWQKISARIPHSVCLKVGNVDRIAIWSGSLGLTRAHSGSLGLTRARSVCCCLELISVSFQPYDLEP